MSTPHIIAFTKDWDDVPTCTTHILREMAKSIPVLWVSSIGTRKPEFGTRKDLGRVWRRVRAGFKRAEQKENNLRVLWPVLVPRAGSRFSVALNRRLMRWYERRERKWLGDGPVEYWCFVPNAVDLLPVQKGRKDVQKAQISPPETRNLKPETSSSKVVYYCADDWTLFHNLDGEWMAGKERQLIGRADHVFATSRVLEKVLHERGAASVQYMPHGVEYARFAAAAQGVFEIPDELAALSHPIVGFYGNLHPWVDLELVAELAKRRPTWSFVLIGHPYCDTGVVSALPNVHLLGRREHSDLPAYCAGFDAAMIPYDLENERMKSVNPVKTRELLAAGVPVVAPDIEELARFGKDVMICATVKEWLAALEHQVWRTDRNEISARMANDDWVSRVVQIRRIVERGRECGAVCNGRRQHDFGQDD